MRGIVSENSNACEGRMGQKNGSWVVLTPDEDMFIEDLSRANSLRIRAPNRVLPRGIGNGGSYRFGAPWYTAEELEVLRDEARLLAMVVPGGVENVEGQEDARRCVPVEGQSAILNETAVLGEVLVADQEVEREPGS